MPEAKAESAKPNADLVLATDVMKLCARFLVPGHAQAPLEDVLKEDVHTDRIGDSLRDRFDELKRFANRAGIPLELKRTPQGTIVRIPPSAFAAPGVFEEWCERHGYRSTPLRRSLYQLLVATTGDSSCVKLANEVACAALSVAGDSYEGMASEHARTCAASNHHVQNVSQANAERKQVRITYTNGSGDTRERDVSPCDIFITPGNPNQLYFKARDAGDPEGEVKTFRFSRVTASRILNVPMEGVPDSGPLSVLPFQIPLTPTSVPAPPGVEDNEPVRAEKGEPFTTVFLMSKQSWVEVEVQDRRQGSATITGSLVRFQVDDCLSPLQAARWAIRKNAKVVVPRSVAVLQEELLKESEEALRTQCTNPVPGSVNPKVRPTESSTAPLAPVAVAGRGRPGPDPWIRRLASALAVVSEPDSLLDAQTLQYTFGLSDEKTEALLDALRALGIDNSGDRYFSLVRETVEGQGRYLTNGLPSTAPAPDSSLAPVRLRSLRLNDAETRMMRIALWEAGAPQDLIDAVAAAFGDPNTQQVTTDVPRAPWNILKALVEGFTQPSLRPPVAFGYPGHGTAPQGAYQVEPLDLYRRDAKWYLYAKVLNGPKGTAGPTLTFRVDLMDEFQVLPGRCTESPQDAPHRDAGKTVFLMALSPASPDNWEGKVGFRPVPSVPGLLEVVDHGTDYIPALIVALGGLLVPAGSPSEIARLCDRCETYLDKVRSTCGPWYRLPRARSPYRSPAGKGSPVIDFCFGQAGNSDAVQTTYSGRRGTL